MAKKIEPAIEPAIEDTSSISKNLLGSLLQGYKDSHHNFNIQPQVVIPSGSLKLDFLAQIKTGTTIRMGGPAEVGKTSQSLLYAQNFMNTMPKSKTIYVNAEAKFGSEIQARTGMKFTMDSDTWEYGSVFIFQTNVFDTICNTLKSILTTMHEQGEHLCIIIDSVDMLKLKDSADKKIGEGKKPAGVNWLTKEMFRQLGQEIQAFNSLLIMITQYADTFKLDPYAPETPHLMGGNNTHALNHQASYAFYYRPRAKSHYILEHEGEKPDLVKNKILGVNAMIDIKKSATDETGVTIEVPIKKGKVGNCIWTEKEIFDALIYWGLVTREKAKIEISKVVDDMAKEDKIELKLKHIGLAQFSEYFETNPDKMEWIIKKIKSVQSQ